MKCWKKGFAENYWPLCNSLGYKPTVCWSTFENCCGQESVSRRAKSQTNWSFPSQRSGGKTSQLSHQNFTRSLWWSRTSAVHFNGCLQGIFNWTQLSNLSLFNLSISHSSRGFLRQNTMFPLLPLCLFWSLPERV